MRVPIRYLCTYMKSMRRQLPTNGSVWWCCHEDIRQENIVSPVWAQIDNNTKQKNKNKRDRTRPTAYCAIIQYVGICVHQYAIWKIGYYWWLSWWCHINISPFLVPTTQKKRMTRNRTDRTLAWVLLACDQRDGDNIDTYGDILLLSQHRYW